VLGAHRFPVDAEQTSGFELAGKVDLLLRGAQCTRAEHPRPVGWAHSTLHQALAFASRVGARHLVAFHRDPGRDDAALGTAIDTAVADVSPDFPVTPRLRATPSTSVERLPARSQRLHHLRARGRSACRPPFDQRGPDGSARMMSRAAGQKGLRIEIANPGGSMYETPERSFSQRQWTTDAVSRSVNSIQRSSPPVGTGAGNALLNSATHVSGVRTSGVAGGVSLG